MAEPVATRRQHHWEAVYSDDIAAYYLNPHDLGYWPFVRFDHEFVGQKRWSRWATRRSEEGDAGLERCRYCAGIPVLFHPGGDNAKYIDLPIANYSSMPYDKVLKDGKTVGISTYSGYTHNERSMVSLATMDIEHSNPGAEVTLVWGEENRGSSKPTVERHMQAIIRAYTQPH
jgi:vanillate/3-O-methylgallate O-demethylase